MSFLVLDNLDAVWDSTDSTTFAVDVYTGSPKKTADTHIGITAIYGAESQKIYKNVTTTNLIDYNELRVLARCTRKNTRDDPEELDFFMQFSFITSAGTTYSFPMIFHQNEDGWEMHRFSLRNISQSDLEQVVQYEFKCLLLEDDTWESQEFFLELSLLGASNELFIEDIDRTIKTKLEKCYINQEPVKTFVEKPEEEFVIQSFPSFSLSQIDIQKDEERLLPDGIKSGYIQMSGHQSTRPIAQPVIIMYQIDAWSKFARDDRRLQSFIFNEFPQRGYILVGDKDFDCWQTGYRKLDTGDENENRLFRKSFTYIVKADIESTDYTDLPMCTEPILEVEKV
jgi:hypothetical protein